MDRKIELIIFLLLAAIIAGFGYWAFKRYGPEIDSVLPLSTPSSKACTLEAKLCPDGSYVGRTGPNCEFSPCP